ncbi:serine protease [uncultured Sphingomonas sp.]|uniref:S1 family peptidase n=1 Tax=uncultured Sphingomonas sp. TaxID=158754 RepID=UPI0025F17B68|nr:serine protease [uncultured Sphingomonas sp.]
MSIRSEGGQGTAFVYGSGTQTCFVTAAHVLAGAREGGFILMRRYGEWKSFPLTMVSVHPDGQDLALFAVSGLVLDIEHAFIHPNDPKLYPGQELKFTGFPHGLENLIDSPMGFSTPLVRTAFLSGTIILPDKGGALLVLDGLNNPGYSGGPVWAPGPTLEQPTLLGVISGYRVELKSKSRVYKDLGEKREAEIPDLFVKPNSGMIHAVPYAELVKLAAKNTVFNSHQ